MKRIKRIAVAAVMAATMLVLPGLTGTANAATQVPNNPYTPEGLCESGGLDTYEIVDHMTLAGGKATVYLLRTWSNGHISACAVTMKQGDAVGNSTTISAWIEGPIGDCPLVTCLSGDEGEFQYYAGPLLKGTSCVHWGGRYGDDTAKKTPCG
jgi:hypothetical protein